MSTHKDKNFSLCSDRLRELVVDLRPPEFISGKNVQEKRIRAVGEMQATKKMELPTSILVRAASWVEMLLEESPRHALA